MEPAETSELRAKTEVAAALERPAELERQLAELWQSSSAPAFGIAKEEFAQLLFCRRRALPIRPDRERCGHETRHARTASLSAPASYRRFRPGPCLRPWRRSGMGTVPRPLPRAALPRRLFRLPARTPPAASLPTRFMPSFSGCANGTGSANHRSRANHGRGSLAGWLRATLAQRMWTAIAASGARRRSKRSRSQPRLRIRKRSLRGPPPCSPATLEKAVRLALGELDSEDRLLIASYYFDGRTVRELGLLLGVHASTISRRLERLYALVRKRILRELRAEGLSRRQAEEIMQSDVRDMAGNLDLPLKKILQFPHSGAFQSGEAISAEGGTGDAR